MSRGAITNALGGHAAAANKTKQGRVSAFTSRHQQQGSSLAATLYVMAAAHVALRASLPLFRFRPSVMSVGVLGSPPLAVCVSGAARPPPS